MGAHLREDSTLYDRVHIVRGGGGGTGRADPVPSASVSVGSAAESDGIGKIGSNSGDPPIPPRKARSVKGRVDLKQRRAIDRLLETIYIKDKDGFWSYEAGWDDKRVAVEAAGDERFVSAVQYCRVECYGPLRKAEKPGSATNERLLKMITYLYAQLGVAIPDDLH